MTGDCCEGLGRGAALWTSGGTALGIPRFIPTVTGAGLSAEGLGKVADEARVEA